MKDFTYMLAPIEDMTGCAFRTICYQNGADLTFTEMTRIVGLAKKNKSTWSRIELKDDTPTVIQLLGANEPELKKFLSMFQPSKGFKGFNLNAGCPNPQVVKLGQGCAMVRRISKTKKLINLLKDHGYSTSIKMRLGLNRIDKMHKSYLNLIDAVDPDFFIVHARYGLQTYKEPADFGVYEECVKLGKIIIANGDIKTKEQIEYLKEIGVKGAMIGRAAVLDPTIFNKLKGIDSPPLEKVRKDFIELTNKFNEPFKHQRNVLKIMGNKNFEY